MKRELLIRCSIFIVGMLLGIALFLIGDRLLTSYEVSKLPAPFKLFGEQGVEMFSTSCGIPKIIHSYEDSADSSLFKGQYEDFVAKANDSAEVVGYEFTMNKNELVFIPTCQGSALVYFYPPQGNEVKVVLVKKTNSQEYEYKSPSS